MKDRFISSTILLLVFVLGAALILPNRTISGVMQTCGQFISDVFGY
jgi:hypothetical protein